MNKITALFILILKITRLSNKLILKTFKIDNNKIVKGDNNKTNKIIIDLSKSKKLKNNNFEILMYVANIRVIEILIFLILNIKKVFNY